MERLKSAESILKFSEITPADWNAGAAMFTLLNMGALKRKLNRGEDDVILRFIEVMAAGFLLSHGIVPPDADYTPPVEQEST